MFNSTILLYSVLFYLILHTRLLKKEIRVNVNLCHHKLGFPIPVPGVKVSVPYVL